jgi:hypothetical protein
MGKLFIDGAECIERGSYCRKDFDRIKECLLPTSDWNVYKGSRGMTAPHCATSEKYLNYRIGNMRGNHFKFVSTHAYDGASSKFTIEKKKPKKEPQFKLPPNVSFKLVSTELNQSGDNFRDPNAIFAYKYNVRVKPIEGPESPIVFSYFCNSPKSKGQVFRLLTEKLLGSNMLSIPCHEFRKNKKYGDPDYNSWAPMRAEIRNFRALIKEDFPSY